MRGRSDLRQMGVEWSGVQWGGVGWGGVFFLTSIIAGLNFRTNLRIRFASRLALTLNIRISISETL